ncbi:DUF2716 domain-containing protein [Pontibacillus yanchengensis]|uniref:DUF2716 domain-containing protein n=1 Tax=Pontibacillus yanchengensis TaxID=462910 RepID=A0ACC7VGL6_9BACI|nr:DUF2716 domain-containing protein [Pontibacillus yanchengensis]
MKLGGLEMKNWVLLCISEFPSFKVPSPYITYDISYYFVQSEDLDTYEELEEKALLIFQNNT